MAPVGAPHGRDWVGWAAVTIAAMGRSYDGMASTTPRRSAPWARLGRAGAITIAAMGRSYGGADG